MYDLIIIGAGPAGITAAIYAARKNLKLLVLSEQLGGQVIYNLSVENYTGFQEISGAELVQKFNQHLENFKFDFIEEKAISIVPGQQGFKVKTSPDTYESKSVIVSTGTSPKQLGVKGEKEYRNRGISYCATCDAPLFSGKKVAVIGGGNHALYTAIQLESIASHIYVLNSEKQLSGKPKLIEKIKDSNKTTIINQAQIIEITGKDLVQGLRYQQGANSRSLSLEGIFISIGYRPQTDFVKELVKLNENGEIVVDTKNSTSREGVFAAGDCTNYPYKQIIIAAGQGASAVLSSYEYLNNL